MSPLDLTRPRAAIAASEGVRERVRSLPPTDPARVAALRGSLGTLDAAWTAEHRKHCRRGPQADKATYKSSDPVRVLGRERQAEIRRVRSMLRPTTGTPRAAAGATPKPGQRKSARTYSFPAMRGAVGYAERRLTEIDSEHEEHRDAVRRRSVYTLRDLREDAADLLGQLEDARQNLTNARAAYVRGWDEADDPYEDDWKWVHDRVALLRKRADRIGRELRQSTRKRRRTPQELAEREPSTWTRQRILSALDAYARDHGNLPTASRCNARPDLPAYTLVTRKLGPKPMTEARRLLRLPGGALASASS